MFYKNIIGAKMVKCAPYSDYVIGQQIEVTDKDAKTRPTSTINPYFNDKLLV